MWVQRSDLHCITLLIILSIFLLGPYVTAPGIMHALDPFELCLNVAFLQRLLLVYMLNIDADMWRDTAIRAEMVPTKIPYSNDPFSIYLMTKKQRQPIYHTLESPSPHVMLSSTDTLVLNIIFVM